MRIESVETLEKIMGQFEGLHRELLTLVKKSPNDGINKFKLKYINQILFDSNAFLGDQYQPLKDFTQFDEDDLPTTSDVTFVISLYLEEIERFRSDHIKPSGFGGWIYNLKDSEEKIRTAPPKKIKEKK